jgi:hypothetical protein
MRHMLSEIASGSDRLIHSVQAVYVLDVLRERLEYPDLSSMVMIAGGLLDRMSGCRPHQGRAAYSQRRSSNANSLWWRVLAEPAGVITTSHIHGSRTDS